MRFIDSFPKTAAATPTRNATFAAMILCVNQHNTLTLREQQILYYVANGLSNKEIAARLSLSEQTVKAHLANMTAKSRKTNRAALVAYGFETGILRSH